MKIFFLLLFAIATLLGAMRAQGAAAEPLTPSPSAPVSSSSPTSSAVPAAWVAFEHAWTNITAYTATVTMFERKDTQAQNSVFDYTFHKPASATVHYNQGENAGVTIVWSGGDTLVAHRGSGLSALFTKKFDLHDPAVMTIRGSSVDQLSFAAILAHGQDTAGATSQAVGPVIDGVRTEAVTLVPYPPVTNSGLTREVIDISTSTNLPARVLGYDGDTLVRQIDFSNVKPTANQ
jgi:hypothetical protein